MARRISPERHLLVHKEQRKARNEVEALAVADGRVVAHKRRQHAAQFLDGPRILVLERRQGAVM